jgi:hypothetical protein
MEEQQDGCHRQRVAGRRDWWHCKHCWLSWSERDTGESWRPAQCPLRMADELLMEVHAQRDARNHDGK